MVQKLKILVNCGAAEPWIEQCLESLRMQTYPHWEAFVTVDPCGDETGKRALKIARSDSRIHVTGNAIRLYSLANVVNAIRRSGADDEDVIVQLDGDDWLYMPQALAIIAEAYTHRGAWITYGSWIPDCQAHLHPAELPATVDLPKDHGRWPAYPGGTTDFREERWLATQVKTWKKWLFGRIDDADLRNDKGEYFQVAQDLAIMFPLLEMSGVARALHISEPLMVYNMANPHRCSLTRRAEQLRNTAILRARKRYACLAVTPYDTRSNLATLVDETRFGA